MTLSGKGRRRARTLAKALLSALIVAFLCWQIWRVRHGVGDSLRSVGWGAFVLATAFAVLGTFLGFLAWRTVVTGSGVRVTLADGAWLYFLSGVTLYLPGMIWPTVTQAALAKRVGVPATKVVSANLVALILSMLSGVMVGLLALPRLVGQDPAWWLMLPLLLAGCVVMVTPRLLRRLLDLGQRFVRRGEVELPAGGSSMRTIALSVLGWSCTGMHAAVIAISLGAPATSAMTLGVGGFALSVVTGGLSLVPAGIGVREAVLGLTLGSLVSGPDLVTLLLLSRVLTTLGHVGATLIALGSLAALRSLRWRSRKNAAANALTTE